MNYRKAIWITAPLTVAAFVIARYSFPYSIYLGRGTRDPDKYEVIGWLVMLLMYPVTIVLLAMTVGLGVLIRATPKK